MLIPCRDAAATLERCLEALGRQRGAPGLRVIVVDDGSRDGSAELAERCGAQVLRRNAAGRAAALNAGLELIDDGLVLFTDADCLVSDDWAAGLVGRLESDPGLAGAGGNLWPSGLNPAELAKLLPYIEEFEGPIALGPREQRVALNANNMILRRAALRDVAGFDSGLLHGADADLTRRLLARGHRLERVIEPRVLHLKRDGLRGLCRTAYARGSTVAVHLKHGRFNALDLLRGFGQPLTALISGYRRLARLRRLLPAAGRTALLLAPWALACGRLCEAVGRVRYYPRFRGRADGR